MCSTSKGVEADGPMNPKRLCVSIEVAILALGLQIAQSSSCFYTVGQNLITIVGALLGGSRDLVSTSSLVMVPGKSTY